MMLTILGITVERLILLFSAAGDIVRSVYVTKQDKRHIDCCLVFKNAHINYILPINMQSVEE